MTRQLTCIGCPMGCQLTATVENGVVTTVTGNTCKRGDDYARKECVAPMRTVTGTVRMADGRVVSVRTRTDVPKAKMFDVAEAFNRARPAAPLHIGDVVIADVCGTGVDVVATSNRE
ncbi:MAG: DUF1667 domain-containing protein [Oscillospiraceae bacterium]|nr:DUF1667 domain-containing protein [Oscillospiraceae bacterium]